jgi:hypothetical protein
MDFKPRLSYRDGIIKAALSVTHSPIILVSSPWFCQCRASKYCELLYHDIEIFLDHFSNLFAPKSSEIQSDIPQIQNTCTAGVAGKLTPYIV